MSKSSRVVVGLLAFIWLVGVVVSYYVTHKPFSPVLALSLAQSGFRIMAPLALCSLAGGLGRRLSPFSGLHPLAKASLQAALGLGILGMFVFLAGILGGLRTFVAWGTLLVLLVVLRKDVIAWWRDWGGLWQVWEQGGRLGRLLAVCAGLLLFFALAIALAPPLKFDALVYHLSLPHNYLAAQRFVYVPQIVFWGMPQMGEMLYTWAILLAGDPGAVVLGWLTGALALLGILGFAAGRLGPRPAWVSVAALLSGFTLAAGLAWGYVDWLVMLFGVGFLVTFDRWVQSGERQDILWSGVFAGLAMGTKYSASVLLLAGLTGVVWFGLAKRRERKSFGTHLFLAVQLGLVAILVAAPWLVKNLWATGNPFYPLLFPSGEMDAFRLLWYQGGSAWGRWVDSFLLPVSATLMGVEQAPGYGASIGPLLLGLSLAAALGWRRLSEAQRGALRSAILVAIPGLAVWAVLENLSHYLRQSRLYFAFFPALAILAGAGFAVLARTRLSVIRLGRLAGLLVAMALGLNVFEIGTLTLSGGALQAALGLQPPDAYLSAQLGWYAPAMQAVRALPPGSRALMLWEARSLYCLPNCEPDEILDRWLRERYSAVDSPRPGKDILRDWQQAGYTHVLYNRFGADYIRHGGGDYQPEDWQELDRMLSGLGVVQDFGGAYQLYEISP